MNTTEKYIYRTACAATGKTAELDSADFDVLWDLSRSHNMTALTAKGLMSTEAFKNADEAEQKRWKNALNNSVKKTMLFDAERKQILKAFEDNGIWYLPLKGAILNGFYKSYGSREFADNDILVDPGRTKDAKQIMLERGYVFRSDEFSSDEYSKPPIYNFEIHRSLVEEIVQFEKVFDYYRDVKSRLVKDEGNLYGYSFTDDDFYIFLVFHAFKHYEVRGTGYRTIADEYVALHSGKLRLDFDYITGELEKMGIREFEEKLRSLSEKLYTQPEMISESIKQLNSGELEMLRFIMSCTTFGKLSNLIKRDLESLSDGKKPAKGKYILKRIFPERSRFKYSNPFVYKHKIVYPFFLIYRLVANPIRHRRYLKQEIKAVKNIK